MRSVDVRLASAWPMLVVVAALLGHLVSRLQDHGVVGQVMDLSTSDCVHRSGCMYFVVNSPPCGRGYVKTYTFLTQISLTVVNCRGSQIHAVPTEWLSRMHASGDRPLRHCRNKLSCGIRLPPKRIVDRSPRGILAYLIRVYTANKTDLGSVEVTFSYGSPPNEAQTVPSVQQLSELAQTPVEEQDVGSGTLADFYKGPLSHIGVSIAPDEDTADQSEVMGSIDRNNVGTGRWTVWSPWSDCSVTCGPNGELTRRRTCTGGPGNRKVACSGEASQSAPCDPTPVECPEAQTVPSVQQLSELAQTPVEEQDVGSGSLADFYKGLMSHIGVSIAPDEDIADQSEVMGSIDRNNVGTGRWTVWSPWSLWSPWSDCSVTCGPNGELTRWRTCTGGPGNRKVACSGEASQSAPCDPTPVECPGVRVETVQAIEGKEAMLKCIYEKLVLPVKIYWLTPDGKKITPESQDKRYESIGDALSIAHAAEENNGVYQCVVTDAKSHTVKGEADIGVINCASSPCNNGAVCEEGGAIDALDTKYFRFQCQCGLGYHGTTCELGMGTEAVVVLIVLSLVLLGTLMAIGVNKLMKPQERDLEEATGLSADSKDTLIASSSAEGQSVMISKVYKLHSDEELPDDLSAIPPASAPKKSRFSKFTNFLKRSRKKSRSSGSTVKPRKTSESQSSRRHSRIDSVTANEYMAPLDFTDYDRRSSAAIDHIGKYNTTSNAQDLMPVLPVERHLYGSEDSENLDSSSILIDRLSEHKKTSNIQRASSHSTHHRTQNRCNMEDYQNLIPLELKSYRRKPSVMIDHISKRNKTSNAQGTTPVLPCELDSFSHKPISSKVRESHGVVSSQKIHRGSGGGDIKLGSHRSKQQDSPETDRFEGRGFPGSDRRKSRETIRSDRRLSEGTLQSEKGSFKGTGRSCQGPLRGILRSDKGQFKRTVECNKGPFGGPLGSPEGLSYGTFQGQSEGTVVSDKGLLKGRFLSSAGESEGKVAFHRVSSKRTVRSGENSSYGTAEFDEGRFNASVRYVKGLSKEITDSNEGLSGGTVTSGEGPSEETIRSDQESSNRKVEFHKRLSEGTVVSEKGSGEGTVECDKRLLNQSVEFHKSRSEETVECDTEQSKGRFDMRTSEGIGPNSSHDELHTHQSGSSITVCFDENNHASTSCHTLSTPNRSSKDGQARKALSHSCHNGESSLDSREQKVEDEDNVDQDQGECLADRLSVAWTELDQVHGEEEQTNVAELLKNLRMKLNRERVRSAAKVNSLTFLAGKSPAANPQERTKGFIMGAGQLQTMTNVPTYEEPCSHSTSSPLEGSPGKRQIPRLDLSVITMEESSSDEISITRACKSLSETLYESRQSSAPSVTLSLPDSLAPPTPPTPPPRRSPEYYTAIYGPMSCSGDSFKCNVFGHELDDGGS